jgi:hypothetical protein
MPFGCSVWPAWWSFGDSKGNGDKGWPTKGEIDIIEGVHNGPQNAYTLHTDFEATGRRCKIDPGKKFTGEVKEADCKSDGSNLGCGIKDKDTRSWGDEFKKAGGGVFAMLWDDQGIRFCESHTYNPGIKLRPDNDRVLATWRHPQRHQRQKA